MLFQKIILLCILFGSLSLASAESGELFSLTIKVSELQNSKGVVQFALYNKDGTIPDEAYTKYYKIRHEKINAGSAYVVFNALPAGRYAVNVLHDENMNGKIDKGFLLPIEGIGFTNYDSIGLANRPSFLKASFDLNKNTEKIIKIIYL